MDSPDDAPVGAPPPEGLDVLVVDDLPANRAVTAALLRPFGHRCALASSGPEALLALQRRAFDAVIVDLRMPDMDGFEVTRRLRALPGQAGEAVVIGVTAYVRTGQAQEGLSAGMDAVLTRPIPGVELDDELRAARRHRAPVPILDAALRRARQAEAPDGEAAERDQERLTEAASRLAGLQDAPPEAIQGAAEAIAALCAEIGALRALAAARTLAARPEAARLLLPPLASAVVATRSALRAERVPRGRAVPI